MVQVAKLGHIALNTPNLESLLAYYTDVLGFSVTERSGDGEVYLSTDVDHHNVILYPGTQTGIRHVAFQLGEGLALRDAESQLRDLGIKVTSMTDAQPGIVEILEFADPEGYIVQLYQSIAQAPDVLLAPEKPIRPQKIGHVALRAQDVQGMAEFYQSVLGFRVSDWMGDFFVFMRCGPDHHTINFLHSPQHTMQHVAFQVANWASIESACDHLAKHNISLIWGPGRHGIGHNIFTYHLDPDNNIVELFTELDIMLNEELGYFEPRPWHEDVPQKPKVWEPSLATSNKWGAGPPEIMMQ
ncbi:MAG: VOC family protein [Chloroflexi bacterium]|nr:VOC family protein [Chloroflexota bacterium]